MENSTWNWSTSACDVVNCSTKVPVVSTNLQQPGVTKYSVVVLFVATSLFGICGNSLTIFVLFHHRPLRTVIACFILNLAVADNSFLVCLPFMAFSTYTGNWVFGDVACRLMNAFWGANLYASIFTMTPMSVFRYMAVVYPVKSIPYRTCRIAFIVCAVIWALGFLLVLPLPLYSKVRHQQCQVGNRLLVCHLRNAVVKFDWNTSWNAVVPLSQNCVPAP